MKEYYSSGVPYLDNLIGGVLLGDNVVWLLEAGTYFDFFLEYFLTKKEDKQFKNIYVSFDFPPQKIHTRYKNFFREEDFILVDAFTFGKGKGDEFFQSFYTSESIKAKPFRIHCIKEMTEPALFIETIRKLQDEFKEGSLCKYVFDSLTGMQELWGEDNALHFFTYTCPKLFELKALAYWPLAKDAHSKAFLANISYITQLVISLGFQKDSTCIAEFLKMDGRPSQLLNIAHYYNFQDGKINFIEPFEQQDQRTFDMRKVPQKEKGPERVPNFLRNKGSIKIGHRIRGFRKEKNLSQAELARILKVTPSALSQIENNQSLPSLQLFVDIARFFGKSLDSFFTSP
ncbi:MAG: helix-turn-helix domain-containing protein [Thermodesulfobacteriota bacterium]|nr:helix-turn-helix domain-containing protein [Thermodesulfobacteriota bacterium]